MSASGQYHVRASQDDTTWKWQLIGPDAQPLIEANRFLHAVGLRGLVPRSLRTYAYDLLSAFRWLSTAGRTIAGLKEESFLDYIAYQRKLPKATDTTINRRISVLRRFCLFMTDHPPVHSQWLCAGPQPFRRGRRMPGVRVRQAQRLVMPLDHKEASTFLQSFRSARDRAIIFLMWANGLRACEILNLNLDDVDFQNMSIKVFGKGRKERVLPLNENVVQTLLRYISFERPTSACARCFVVLKGTRRGYPMTYTGLHRIFRYHRAITKIKQANPHRFRHTFGSNMTRCRVPLAVLAKMMGHSSPQTTMRYAQLHDHDIRQQYDEALAKLNTKGVLDNANTPPQTNP